LPVSTFTAFSKASYKDAISFLALAKVDPNGFFTVVLLTNPFSYVDN
jgi:hypothetical protein